MLFHEIYGCYFHTVASILRAAARGGLTDRALTALVREHAFAESTLTIPAALESGDWPLLDGALRPVLRHPPTMPLTTLEKRWLKALLQDPRIALFAPDPAGLEEVEPLYQPGTFVLFDQYADGDPYGDQAYIARFREILAAVREEREMEIRARTRTGQVRTWVCAPYRLEYSVKDDKFRLLTMSERGRHTIALARIVSCETLGPRDPALLQTPPERREELTLLLHDQRNGLERVLLHFSHFEKETRRLDGGRYQIRLWYDREDETELLIRVLSFGPVLEVQSPESFIALIRERIARQLALAPPGSPPA